ncbi:MAG: DMT family transporter [Alphaproteobacteria bacterium]|nr:DMT family transporter [Alphaproteobacteria bacterium]
MTQTQAILCALAAFFCWVMCDTCIKLAAQAELPPPAIMGILGIIGVIGIAGGVLYKGDLALLRPQNPRNQAFICLCSLVGTYGTVIALKHLPLTIFYIVVFTAPLAIAVISAFLKYEILTRTKIACLVAGFGGVLLAVAPQGGGNGEWIGYGAALISVLGFAGYTVTIRKISQTDSTESIQFYSSLTFGIVGLLCSLDVTTPGGQAIALMIAAGILNIVASVLYNKALGGTAATNVAQIHYTQIISGAIMGYAIWHEVPTWNLIVGSIIIVASGIIVTHQARQGEIRPA